jgi:5-methylcytosine-specific restriction enzyme subunit McrC
MAGDDGLRTQLQQLVRALDDQVTPVVLDRHVLVRLRRQMTRLTRAYEPAIQLIELLAAGQGVVIEPEISWRLSGFLFDMNRFFEALLFRFLSDHLIEAEVQGQARLQDIFEYEPEFNPRSRRAPRPRPDLVVLQSGFATQLLDAKYRDLWEHPLPREMLYQLSIYTLSHIGKGTATILYPTTSPAREARIAIRDPVGGQRRGLVTLRPVRLDELTELLTMQPTVETMRRRWALAHQLVYGRAATSVG